MVGILNLIWLFLGSSFIPILIFSFLFKVLNRSNQKNLDGKVVLITGCSSGLGEALAHTFYNAGCKLILLSRNIEQLNKVKEQLIAKSTVCRYKPEVHFVDLNDLKSIPSILDSILTNRNIDILINNAGISYRGKAVDTKLEVDMKLMFVNYFGQIALVKGILPQMIARKEGHIVMISSIQGKFGIPYRSAYAASKHALQAYSDCLRAEVSKFNVKITVVSPGYINTNLSLNAITDSGSKYAVLDSTTANGFSSEEVARQVLEAVCTGSKEKIIAPVLPKLLIIIRTLVPSLYFFMMKKYEIKNFKT